LYEIFKIPLETCGVSKIDYVTLVGNPYPINPDERRSGIWNADKLSVILADPLDPFWIRSSINHELGGHGIGGLGDEYFSYDTYKESWNIWPNIDKVGCPKWCSGEINENQACYQTYLEWKECVEPYFDQVCRNGGEEYSCGKSEDIKVCSDNANQKEFDANRFFSSCDLGLDCITGTGCYWGAGSSLANFRPTIEGIMKAASFDGSYGPVGEREINKKLNTMLSIVCGNRICETGEKETCPLDCVVEEHVCGDRNCNGDETCSTCPDDCGVCPPVENRPPQVSSISHDTIDVDSNTQGLQVYGGTTVTYSGSASDPDGDLLSWQWIYTINGGTEIVFLSGTGDVTDAVFTYGPGTTGNIYTWILRATDSVLSAESHLKVSILETQVEPSLCSSCGDGLFNLCDEQECLSLGNCKFVDGLLGNKCEEVTPFCGNNICEEGENQISCPQDCELISPQLIWSSYNPIPGMHCVQILEVADPHTWDDNYLCSEIDYGFVWSSAGPVSGMNCIQFNEPADPYTWDDNYLCSEKDYGGKWSSAGPISGMNCVRIYESADPHTWDDNYLCFDYSEPICGNGIIESGEQCDDGAANSDSATCTTACKNNICGDGLVYLGIEECDDDNLINGDGCSSLCQLETCAEQNGFICNSDELCPGSALTASDTEVCCNVGCVITSGNTCDTCGDGLFNICDRTKCESFAEGCLFNDNLFVNTCIACVSRNTFACFDNDVYWFDTCGDREEKKEECGSGGCEDVACLQPLVGQSTFVEANVLISGLQNMYAPTVLEYSGIKRMWIGGWLTQQDYGGDDAIYYSEFKNSAWTFPILSFAKLGYLVNDPTVIQPPSSGGIDRSNWLYMYYTALDNKKTAQPITDHVVGFASSTDGGKTWTDHGIIIEKNNGFNDCGAWAPSALVNGNEIWIYYHGNDACFTTKFLTRLKLNGLEVIDTQTITSHDLAVNVDVAKQGAKFVMVANHPAESFIYRYESQDGINFGIQSFETLISAGENLVTTPHIEVLDPNRYKLYFGFSTTDNLHHESIHAWEFEYSYFSTI